MISTNEKLSARLRDAAAGMNLRLMEVCGTHTAAIFRSGLRSFLPAGIRLVAGPGCPVCVTPPETVDRAIALSRLKGVTIATFGDMLKVPGSASSLREERGRGADIRVIYSPLESLEFARAEPARKVVLLGVGFETTIAPAAAAVAEAARSGIGNFYFLSAGRRVIPAMEHLLKSGDFRIDGFICPGHASTVIGLGPYRRISRNFKVPCVIAGFEASEILAAVVELVLMIRDKRPAAVNLYRRVVAPRGNPRARRAISEAFRIVDAEWRGMGTIEKSGYALRRGFEAMDAGKRFEVVLPPPREPAGCLCGKVVSGAADPADCEFFGRGCTPERPLGPCMVASEGACAAWFRYGRFGPGPEAEPGKDTALKNQPDYEKSGLRI